MRAVIGTALSFSVIVQRFFSFHISYFSLKFQRSHLSIAKTSFFCACHFLLYFYMVFLLLSLNLFKKTKFNNILARYSLPILRSIQLVTLVLSMVVKSLLRNELITRQMKIFFFFFVGYTLQFIIMHYFKSAYPIVMCLVIMLFIQ